MSEAIRMFFIGVTPSNLRAKSARRSHPGK
jgi:hypothetical protein